MENIRPLQENRPQASKEKERRTLPPVNQDPRLEIIPSDYFEKNWHVLDETMAQIKASLKAAAMRPGNSGRTLPSHIKAQGSISEGGEALAEMQPKKRKRKTTTPAKVKKNAETSSTKKRKPYSKKAVVADMEGCTSQSPSARSRENVEWNNNQAESIIGETQDGKNYFVKRDGVGYHGFGVMDARSILGRKNKEMVEDYKAFKRTFSRAITTRTNDKGELNLGEEDNLDRRSLLEACYLLEKFRELDGPLHTQATHHKRDALIQVPALGLSFLVQRLLNIERARADRLEADLKRLQEGKERSSSEG